MDNGAPPSDYYVVSTLMIFVDRREFETLYALWNTCSYYHRVINCHVEDLLYQVFKAHYQNYFCIDVTECACNFLVMAYHQNHPGEIEKIKGVIHSSLRLSCLKMLLRKDYVFGLEIFPEQAISHGFINLKMSSETIIKICARLPECKDKSPAEILSFLWRRTIGNLTLMIRLCKESDLPSDHLIHSLILKLQFQQAYLLLSYVKDFDAVIARAMKIDSINTMKFLEFLDKNN